MSKVREKWIFSYLYITTQMKCYHYYSKTNKCRKFLMDFTSQNMNVKSSRKIYESLIHLNCFVKAYISHFKLHIWIGSKAITIMVKECVKFLLNNVRAYSQKKTYYLHSINFKLQSCRIQTLKYERAKSKHPAIQVSQSCFHQNRLISYKSQNKKKNILYL